MNRLTWPRATIVFLAFIGLAALQAWPLPLHLGTHLTGPPSGDTGVYVWNTWVFRHEMFDHGAWPFYVAGVNTYIPTPWALLRYVPPIAEARMPGRMAIVATMAVAMVFAGALSAWTTRVPRRRGWILLGVAALLWIDLMPAPRQLLAAGIPAVYDRIAADPRAISVLALPTGVRDGLSSLGNFTAHSQFFQTVHGKRIVGGYLSRNTSERRASYVEDPVLGPLVDLSEGRPVSRNRWDVARAAAPAFARNIKLGYVVISHRRASADLRRFATDVLRLTAVQSDKDRSLYVPFGRP
jgi:hypothetical protein